MSRLLLFFFLILSFSCSNKPDYKNSSRATGWKMIGRMGGFAKNYNKEAQEQETGPGLVLIEGGTFTMGKVQDDPIGDWNNTPNQQHVMSFYMDETEVTNLMYLEYIDWVKRVFPPEIDNYKNIYASAVPDTLVWRNSLGFNESMVKNYLRHPAFGEYPVVGVSWLQAVNFCKWRTDRVNEIFLEESGFTAPNARYNVQGAELFSTETYLTAPSLSYGGNDSILNGGKRSKILVELKKDSTELGAKHTDLYLQRKDGIFLPAYRLPTEAEWEYAALGLDGIREYNTHKGRKKYPWNVQYTRSGKRKSQGDQLANFKQGEGDYGGIAGWSDDNADITAKVKSYVANDYGLYDMAGNVAEWVADVYRPIVEDDYNDFNYFRGNVYTKSSENADGTFNSVTVDAIIYDTLPNGKLIPRQLPGELIQVPVDDKETYLRINFSTSDNRNYLDGDQGSKAYNTKNASSTEYPMYNSPVQKTYVDSTGKIQREYDKTANKTTLINDEARVFKGGSWRDREYWLDPAQRRYLPEYMATNYIGFRCAMSRVGSKTNKKKRAR
ncbi:gliding motility-associated lipoprotein GldJ [Aequorivita sublithincola DSM 14238]|uniref:Gliding motility-associated lipoprotein GldJ n=1 Tax=Aequorivita sublithincola (strain DSM 14238 / LMG 21431 / ACAM 643 / 9-3) TaxID=746697 RepID=I3YVS6_AEQSU|nr:gliding motility lipoprotein GldJ [Aequorivita sublithincola]AFL81094.1 gliding motility-associated lipoprotein GldJ [Aequorivita sublithincola DSM 14238]